MPKMKVDLAICMKKLERATQCLVAGAAFCTKMNPWRDSRRQLGGLIGGTRTDYAMARGEIGPKSVHPFIARRSTG
jgi:hypothetical protein